jgi:hypothetical protein
LIIYYITYIPSFTTGGAITKIQNLINSFHEQGCTITWIICTPSVDLPTEITQNPLVFVISGSEKKSHEALANYFGSKNLDHSVLFYRYPLASRSLYQFCLKFGNRLVFEHNTKEPEELALKLKSYTLRDYGYLVRKRKLSRFFKEIRILVNEVYWGSKVLKKAKGGIAVTSEIAHFQTSRVAKYPCLVVGNGVLCSLFAPHVQPVYEGSSLNVLLICSFPNQWHGTDRLIKGLVQYKGKTSIHLHLVGRFSPASRKLAAAIAGRHTVCFYGFVDQARLSQIKGLCHVGIGSLGMHRIPLLQGSVLKVREYLASGMPVAIGYLDEDILRSDLKRFSLQIPADETPVDFAQIDEFVTRMAGVNDLSGTIRHVAREVLDFSIKTTQYSLCFNTLLNENFK